VQHRVKWQMLVRQQRLMIELAIALTCLFLPVSWALTAEVEDGQQATPAVTEPNRSRTVGPQDMSSAKAAGAEESEGEFKPSRAPGVTLIKEDRLKERVQARWDAVINGDFKDAYAFETPEFRKANDPADYAFRLGHASVRWHLASLKELRYDRADQADAVVTIEYSFAISGGELARTSGNFPERWVFLDGDWWRQEIKEPVGGRPHPKPPLQPKPSLE
jgi:hypothetical protein